MNILVSEKKEVWVMSNELWIINNQQELIGITRWINIEYWKNTQRIVKNRGPISQLPPPMVIISNLKNTVEHNF